MNPPSSSISSSDRAPTSRLEALKVALWALGGLFVLDVLANLAFPFPSNPRMTSPSPVALYLDYGRSMEARLRRATRAEPAAAAPITQAGWYDPLIATTRPPKPDSIPVTIYGMSHAMRLGDALHARSPQLSVRTVGAPGATLNWSYGAFLRDRNRGQSGVVVLAVMSSTLPMITSPAPMNWNTSFPLPYTADRFVMRKGELAVVHPPYESYRDYVRTLADRDAWERALAFFDRVDPYYDAWLVRRTWLDNSTLVRLSRRAWAQRRERALRAEVLDSHGFRMDSEPVTLANAIVSDFARRARRQGLVPVIYAVDSKGYSDQLFRALAGTLNRERIAFLSTHRVVNPADPAGYLPDSHFTDANERRLAKAMEDVIGHELGKDRVAKLAASQRQSETDRDLDLPGTVTRPH